MTAVAAGRPASPARADDLQVAGMAPLSTVDWPGRLAATVFCQGCPWDCSYCHNPTLIPPRTPGTLPWQDVLAFLRRRRRLLDAVVLSGGEATRQAALLPAAREVRALGFAVGLHTAGPYPRRLEAVLGDVDWVGLDLKALPEDYDDVVRRPGAGHLAWECLDLLVASGVDHEVRTTVAPGSPAVRHAVEIARRARDAGARAFALQVVRTEGTREEFTHAHAAADQRAWQQEVATLDDQVRALDLDRYDLRPA
ncbi:anaerobic ribonucleoside-triphosphate reductase activating protein [Georgenia satyanarayanai]|uniref:anaerobic ribonucleoside-triphosphate reductase activating protein n=1 Tax=Georgenia satyanarayanai TaxID=860221 RepID=UPI001D00FA07|nr:anaerobic ribonucleoside-triphosphate reductase activating protein [Georgenia satyanarayanai]